MTPRIGNVHLLAYLLGGAVLALAACAPPAPDDDAEIEIARSSAPIIDGTRERGRKQVVVVTFGGAICTGALVADRNVLSAKHCIQQPGADGPALPRDVRVGVGSSAGSGSDIKWFSVASIVTTPGTYSDGVLGVQELSGQDVSILTLVNSVEGVAPLKLNFEDPSDLEGEHATAVGFGQTPDGEVGIKYSVGTTVGRVGEETIQVDGTVCQGDSGGPLINDSDEVFGVVSYGSSVGCGGGASFYQRIDLWADLIRDAIDKSAVCGEDGPESCDGFDNDCDGKVDEDCLGVGEECDADLACLTRLCAQTENGRICTTPCDPLAAENTCGEGYTCASDAECKGVCVPGKPGKKAFGEACESGEDCASLVCADPGDGVSRCLVVCIGDDGLCLAGEACTGGAGQCGECSPSEVVAAALGFDEPCQDDSACRSSLCFDDGGTKYCAAACDSDSDCDERHHCRDNACARGPRQSLGGRCGEHDDCAGGFFCAKTGKGAFCTRTCDDEEPCADGFACEEVSNGSVCIPARQVLGGSCQADKDCASKKCHEKSGTCTTDCPDPNHCGVGLECVRVSNVAGLCLSSEAADAETGSMGDADGGVTPTDKDGGCSVYAPVKTGGTLWLSLLSGLLGCAWARRRRTKRA